MSSLNEQLTMEKSTTTSTPRWKSALITTALLSILLFLYVPFFLKHSPYHWRYPTSRPKNDSPRQIPAIYDSISQDPVESAECASHYGRDYINKFRSSPIGFCSSRSSSSLTCFTHSVRAGRDDTFCIGSPVDAHAAEPTSPAGSSSGLGFTLDCSIPTVRQSTHSAALSLDKFPIYWFDTGPRTILEDHFHYGPLARNKKTSPAFRHNAATNRTLILIKREGAVHDLWHTLLDVMSLRLSLDVLAGSRDPRTGRPFLADADLPRAQIVLMDRFDVGPYADLWTAALTTTEGEHNHLPIVRHEELLPHEIAGSRVLLPLPSGSNPLWHADWTDLPCGSSALLRAFSQRLMNSYFSSSSSPQETSLTTTLTSALTTALHLPWKTSNPLQPASRGADDHHLRITLITRQGSRRLASHASHVAALQSAFPAHAVRSIDFHALTFAQQLRVIRDETDVLVGVHGAFLAHGMFLGLGGEEGSGKTALVEIQPHNLHYRGFRQVARWAPGGVEYSLVEGREPGMEKIKEMATKADGAAVAAAFMAAGGAFTSLGESGGGGGGEGRDWRAAGEVEVEGRKLVEVVGRAVEGVLAARRGGGRGRGEEGGEGKEKEKESL